MDVMLCGGGEISFSPGGVSLGMERPGAWCLVLSAWCHAPGLVPDVRCLVSVSAVSAVFAVSSVCVVTAGSRTGDQGQSPQCVLM